MSQRLENRIAVVIGASQGIGAATARRFAEEGAHVVLCARREGPLRETAEAIRADGGSTEHAILDAGDEQAIKDVVADVVQRHGRLDVLVNNAMQMVPGVIEDMDADSWRKNFTVSVDGAFFASREAFRQMKKQGGGSIINLSSVLAWLATPGTSGYSTAKAAINMLTRSLAIEGARAQVRCNAVAPGVVLTPATESFLPDQASQEATGKSVPIGRIADPRDIANAVLFFASDESAYVTGTCLPVDGGRTVELYTGEASFDD